MPAVQKGDAIQDMATWEPLAQYLAPEDIARLQNVCKTFNIGFHSPKFDLLWQPLLNELHSIDAIISVTPSLGQSIQGAFIAGITKLRERFKAEFEIFRDKDEYIFNSSLFPFVRTLREGKGVTVSDLKAINLEIDAINIKVLMKALVTAKRFNCNYLDMINCHLTRIPGAIIDNQENHDFFCNVVNLIVFRSGIIQELPSNIGKLKCLKILNAHGHQLNKLPESINELTSLKTLILGNNHLTEIPENVGDLKALKSLDLRDNRIKLLPMSIVELPKLKTLNVANNQLTVLPESIGKLMHLETLDVGGNLLTALPESIVKLENLRSLHIDNNQLTEIPPVLVKKFGEEWAKQTLATQKSAPVLNQFKRQSEGLEPVAKRQKQRVGQREMAFISNNQTLVALRKARTTLENHPKRVKIK